MWKRFLRAALEILAIAYSTIHLLGESNLVRKSLKGPVSALCSKCIARPTFLKVQHLYFVQFLNPVCRNPQPFPECWRDPPSDQNTWRQDSVLNICSFKLSYSHASSRLNSSLIHSSSCLSWSRNLFLDFYEVGNFTKFNWNFARFRS
jgi:hypothetical protein